MKSDLDYLKSSFETTKSTETYQDILVLEEYVKKLSDHIQEQEQKKKVLDSDFNLKAKEAQYKHDQELSK